MLFIFVLLPQACNIIFVLLPQAYLENNVDDDQSRRNTPLQEGVALQAPLVFILQFGHEDIGSDHKLVESVSHFTNGWPWKKITTS